MALHVESSMHVLAHSSKLYWLPFNWSVLGVEKRQHELNQKRKLPLNKKSAVVVLVVVVGSQL